MLDAMTDYYRQTVVLERVNAVKAIRYVCYEDLRNGKYCVASGEELPVPHATLSLPAVDSAENFIGHGMGRWFNTLLEAVDDFGAVMNYRRNT